MLSFFRDRIPASCLLSLILIPFLWVSCISCASSVKRVLVQETNKETKYYKSVALIHSLATLNADPDNSPVSSGTAFAIDFNHLITAGHVCKSIKDKEKEDLVKPVIRIMKINREGQLKSTSLGIIIAIDPDDDICLVYVQNHWLVPLALSSNLDDLEIEDRVDMIGVPRGVIAVRRSGRIISKHLQLKGVKSYLRNGFSDLIFLTGVAQPGSSGSPVVSNGEVVGMLVIVMHENFLQDAAGAVKSTKIIEFIQEHIHY